MGCIPSQTESQGKLAIKQNSELLERSKSGEVKVEKTETRSDHCTSSPSRSISKVDSATVEKSNMMDVEMAGNQDVPVWEVQPLHLVRDGKIGRGGAGNVIKATDPSTGRVVALKLIS